MNEVWRAVVAGDNRLVNLFWGTYEQNNAIHRGSANNLAKLVEDDIERIRDLWACGVTAKEIAGWMRVTRQAVVWILQRKTWRHVA